MDIVDMLLMKLQFAVTCTNCQTQIPALIDSWVKNTLSVKML
jgi:hypothetical protein